MSESQNTTIECSGKYARKYDAEYGCIGEVVQLAVDDQTVELGHIGMYPSPEQREKYKHAVACANLLQTAPRMNAMLAEVGADIEMALNGAFEDMANGSKTWREILFDDVEKIKKLLKESRGEQ